MRDIFQNAREIAFQHAANAVTSIGIILIVWLNAIIWWGEPAEHRLLIFLLALGAGLSDLDGQIARRWGKITPYGDVGDRIRDKFFICSLLIYFLKELWNYEQDNIWIALIKGLSILILASECFVAFVIWIVGFVKRLDIEVHWIGKAKVFFYFSAVVWWFFMFWIGDLFQWEIDKCLQWGLVFLLSIGSMCGILSTIVYILRYKPVNNKYAN